MVYGIIYCATNRANGKRYVGLTTRDFEVRKQEHLNENKRNDHFHNALRKYGDGGFTWTIVCKCADERELKDAEEFFIATWQTTEREFGYNMTIGGEHPVLTLDLRKKMSDSMKRLLAEGKIDPPPSWKGKRFSLEHRRKLSESHKRIDKHWLKKPRKPLSEEHKAKLRAAKLGKKRS